MKFFAYLLIAVSLTLGVIASTTAYVPTLDERLVDEQLRINADAGLVVDEDGSWRPLVEDETVMTDDVFATLREGGVERVRVKEFSFARWSHWWLMLLAIAGLLVGAFIVRSTTRKEIQAAMADETSGGEHSPEQVLGRIEAIVAAIQNDIATLPDQEQRLDAIVAQFGEVQATYIPLFIDARARLIAKLGLAGYAEMMDRFAAMERQLNRAWSAAADGVYDEAVLCARNVPPLLAETKSKLM